MSIWIYSDHVRDEGAILKASKSENCMFCNKKLQLLRESHTNVSAESGLFAESSSRRVYSCRVCGWWKILQFSNATLGGQVQSQLYAAAASLREFDISDQSTPVSEIRSYLAARYDARFHIDPWVFEQTVASVYRDLGFHATATARSGDGGIDVILEGPGKVSVGVQVRRYKDKIEVEQIRSLAGALVLRDMTKGIFVTTSSFQSGAIDTTQRFQQRGVAIELLDAAAFYEVLGLAQRNTYTTASDPTAPFHDMALSCVGTRTYGRLQRF